MQLLGLISFLKMAQQFLFQLVYFFPEQIQPISKGIVFALRVKKVFLALRGKSTFGINFRNLTMIKDSSLC